jgi:hypothetical protein
VSTAPSIPQMDGDGRRALSVKDFLRRYSIHRDLFYAEVNAGRIKLRKVGQRSLIAIEDAEAWFRERPTYEPKKKKEAA